MEIKKVHGLYVCPYNGECLCQKMKCSSCGWNPAVAKERLDAFRKEMEAQS